MDQNLTPQINDLQESLAREIEARKAAENLLETKANELIEANQSLEQSIQKARNNASRLNAIMNSMADCIVTTRHDMSILDANNAAEKFLKTSRIHLMNSNFLKYFGKSDTAKYESLCEQAINGGTSGVQEYSFVFDDDTELITEVKISVFEHNDEYFLLHLFHDITHRVTAEQEHKHLQEELAHAAKWEAVGQLAGGIAHEINTPSQYISDNLHFLSDCVSQVFSILEKALELKQKTAGLEECAAINKRLNELIEEYDLGYLVEEMPEALAQSRSGISQVSRIVLAMKNFSHPGASEREPFDINSAIETTLTVSRNEWKNVADVKKDFDPDIGMVNCIPGAMNQVILNLIVNAAHAIADKSATMGLITITTKKSNGGVDILISDTGCGIPEEHRKNIFNPFFTTKEVGKGTGQGLSIAHDIIVQKHDGTINFETETGVGTTFIIHLPQDQQD